MQVGSVVGSYMVQSLPRGECVQMKCLFRYVKVEKIKLFFRTLDKQVNEFPLGTFFYLTKKTPKAWYSFGSLKLV